jgi:allantoin racemase
VTHRTPARRLLYLEGVTYSGAEAARRLALLNQHVSPGFSIEMLIPPDGPDILERAEDFERLRRAELRAVAGVPRGECGALIAAGAFDPNLAELRAAAQVPVIGPGEASLFLARILGSRLVILTVEPAAHAARHMIVRVTARPPVATVRALPATVRSILADPDEGRALLRRAAAAAVHEDKADVLYLGAMTLGTLGIAQDLAATLGVPVIDPLPVCVHAAEAAALTRSSNKFAR